MGLQSRRSCGQPMWHHAGCAACPCAHQSSTACKMLPPPRAKLQTEVQAPGRLHLKGLQRICPGVLSISRTPIMRKPCPLPKRPACLMPASRREEGRHRHMKRTITSLWTYQEHIGVQHHALWLASPGMLPRHLTQIPPSRSLPWWIPPRRLQQSLCMQLTLRPGKQLVQHSLQGRASHLQPYPELNFNNPVSPAMLQLRQVL